VGERVLVAYATKTGCTTGVAEAIGEELAARGYEADVKPIAQVTDLAGYSAVVLGSAVNGGRWLPEAVRFAEQNAAALSAVPTAIFSVHIMNLGDSEKAVRRRTAYTAAQRAAIAPVAEAFFAGKGPEQAETSALTRWVFRAFGGGGEGDCRDWDAIRAWARQVALTRTT
jgi:menaquinone-dependent protoporphyrinogen oxidase